MRRTEQVQGLRLMKFEEVYGGFVKLTGFTPKSRYIVDGSSTQIQ